MDVPREDALAVAGVFVGNRADPAQHGQDVDSVYTWMRTRLVTKDGGRPVDDDAISTAMLPELLALEERGDGIAIDAFAVAMCAAFVYPLIARPILVGDIFTGRKGEVGDFGWMIRQPAYANDLFIFNDNVEAMVSGSLRVGGGNAVIRPYKGTTPPRAWGIPTGTNRGGFPTLDASARAYIDMAIAAIAELIATYHYTQIHYSAEMDGSLGSSIFAFGPDVNAYIMAQLRALCQ